MAIIFCAQTYISYDADIILHVTKVTISLTGDDLHDENSKAVNIRFHRE